MEVSGILELYNEPSHLALLEQIEQLGRPSKQKRQVNSSRDTLDRVMLTELAAIFSKSSSETGNNLLNLISNLLYFICIRLKSAADISEALDKAITIFHPDIRNKAFSVSRQAIKDNLPKDTKANLDLRLKNNYLACMNELRCTNAKSKEIILAIDTTPEETRSKYLNDQYSYCNVGQKNTWRRGFTYSAIFDSTHQLFVSNQHLTYHKSKHEFGAVQPFIKQIQNSCKIVESTGSKVKYIDGDRAYYDGELFAAAFFGLLSAECCDIYDIKAVTPKKFTREKREKKIAFLENPNSQIVELDYIGLSKYTHPALIERCKAANLENDHETYLIPVVKVAAVDEYSAKSHRTLQDLKDEWQKTREKLLFSKKRLSEQNDAYYYLQKAYGVKNPKRLAKITARKRTFKKYPVLYDLYCKIRKILDYIEGLKAKQTSILNALVFFSISLSPKEAELLDPSKYVHIADVYRERWGIENGFKEDKAKFIKSCRSRKPVYRQWNLTMGMMLYNRWHVDRMEMMLKTGRKKAWNRVPWDPRRPYIRRKLEQKYGHKLGAERYLLRLLEMGIKMRINKLLE